MTTFHFVRHGKRNHTIGDPGLTVEGRQEAALTAQAFSSHTIHAIFTSPLRRASETATILAASLGLQTQIDKRLRERMNWGDVPGQSLEGFVALWNRCSQERSYTPPGGDSSRDAGRRIEAFTHSTAKAYPEESVIAVSHGGVIADFLLNVFSTAELAAVCDTFAANPYSGRVIPECSITTVVLREEGYRLERIGMTIGNMSG